MWLLYQKFKNVATMLEHCLQSTSGNLHPPCVHARSVAKFCWWYLPNLYPICCFFFFLSLPVQISIASHLDHSQRPLMCPCLLSLPDSIHLIPCLLLTSANFSGGEAVGAPSIFSQIFQFGVFLQTSDYNICISVPVGFSRTTSWKNQGISTPRK